MTPAVHLLVLSVAVAMAAAAPQSGGDRPPIKFLCGRDECSCQDQDGFEVVTCDCSSATDPEPLLLGDLSAFVSDRTRSLRVRHCSRVSLVPKALSRAISLTELELSDVAQLNLQASSLYTENGPQRRVTLRSVADLRVDPRAFDQVTRLERLELTEVIADRLPLDSFADGADVVALRLTDSRVGEVSLGLSMADAVTVASCTVDVLSADVGDVLSVQIVDNTVKRIDTLRFNVRSNAHSTDTNNVTIARNTIQAMDSDDVHMSLDAFQLANNTLGSLTAPLRVEFSTAEVTGNEIGRLGADVFGEFVRLEAVDLRFDAAARQPAQLAFTFGGNTLRAAGNGSYGRFLSPADADDAATALFRVYGNRFACRCEEMAELVRVGEEASREMAADDDNLATLDEVYGELYRTSKCVEGEQPLDQYRLIAYSDDYACQAITDDKGGEDKTGGAAATAAGLVTLLLAATIAGITV